MLFFLLHLQMEPLKYRHVKAILTVGDNTFGVDCMCYRHRRKSVVLHGRRHPFDFIAIRERGSGVVVVVMMVSVPVSGHR